MFQWIVLSVIVGGVVSIGVLVWSLCAIAARMDDQEGTR